MIGKVCGRGLEQKDTADRIELRVGKGSMKFSWLDAGGCDAMRFGSGSGLGVLGRSVDKEIAGKSGLEFQRCQVRRRGVQCWRNMQRGTREGENGTWGTA